MRTAVGWFALVTLATGACDMADSQCVATPEIAATIEAYRAAGDGTAAEAERKAAQKNVLDQALAQHPTDPFLLDRKRDWFDDNTSSGREASLAYFAALHAKYPDTPGATALYGEVLGMKDSAQAIKLLEASEHAHPNDPWTHDKLLSFYDYGKSRNLDRLREEIDAYLTLCPAPSSGRVYRIIETSGTPEQTVSYAGQLRKQLEAETTAPNQALWIALWNLEFKAAKPAQHPAVRANIRKDLVRLERLSDPHGERWLNFLLKGDQMLGDQAAIERTESRLIQEFLNRPKLRT